MDTLNECLIIGLMCMICCHYLYTIINNKNNKDNKDNKDNKGDKNNKVNKNYYRQSLILCFLFRYLLHYIIKDNNIDNLYCKKVCYNNECFMVCPIINN